jgi:hypothetical protein
MLLRKALIVALVAAGSVGTVAVPATATASTGVYVQIAPPAPRYEVVPAPRRGYVWVPGYWDWRGHRHVWVGGIWVRERVGYRYRPHEWIERGGRWEFNRGGWDRDHDGIPDRYDRHPNNPYRP